MLGSGGRIATYWAAGGTNGENLRHNDGALAQVDRRFCTFTYILPTFSICQGDWAG